MEREWLYHHRWYTVLWNDPPITDPFQFKGGKHSRPQFSATYKSNPSSSKTVMYFILKHSFGGGEMSDFETYF